MNKTKKIMRKQVGAAALVLAMSCWLPGMALAEENSDSVQAKGTQAVAAEQQSNQEQGQASEQKSETKAGNNPDVADTATQNGNVPVAEVEVKADKEKQKLTIGQQENAEGVKDYVITHSYAGSKSDVENKDLPQSIASVGQKVMQEQHVTTIDQALSNIAGVTPGLNSLDYWDTSDRYAIRGFGAGFNAPFYVNGLSDRYSVMSRWTGNLDRIEVLKGPAAVLYGNGSPGGLINFVTKKPLPYESYTIGTDLLSWRGRSIDLDMSIPLTKDKKWLSRTILQNADYGDFRWGDTRYKRFDGDFIVQGQPKQDLTYTFEAGYHHHIGADPGDIGFVPGIRNKATYYWLLPYDANYTKYKKFEFIARTIQARVDYKLNDIWTIHSALGYSERSTYRDRIMGTRTVNRTNLTQTVSWSQGVRESDTKSWDTNANGKFKAWGLNHDLTLGYTWAYSTWNNPWSKSCLRYGSISLLEDQDYPTPYVQYSYTNSASTEKRLGTYISDIVELSPKVKFTAGGSWTRQKLSDVQNPEISGHSSRLGFTYEASPGVTWFVGRSTYYEPQSPSTNDAGQTFYFTPESGDQVEGGVKVDMSNRASVTLSTYRINRGNMVFGLDTDPKTYVQIGKITSKGMELDATYAIRPWWNLLLSYSYCNGRVVTDDYYASGSPIPYIPKHTLKLWTTYEAQDGHWKGWGFGGGLTHVGTRALDYNVKNWGYLAGYNTIDGVIYYKPSSDCRYSLNIYNLTNRKYWEYGNGSYFKAGNPRNFILRAEWTFR